MSFDIAQKGIFVGKLYNMKKVNNGLLDWKAYRKRGLILKLFILFS